MKPSSVNVSGKNVSIQVNAAVGPQVEVVASYQGTERRGRLTIYHNPDRTKEEIEQFISDFSLHMARRATSHTERLAREEQRIGEIATRKLDGDRHNAELLDDIFKAK